MNIIYEVLSGSHAYGLATGQADEDVRGIFLPSAEDILGFGYKETRTQQPDKVYHCLRKYLSLVLKANPSLLAWLWVEPRFIRQNSILGIDLRCARKRFLSKLVYKTFGGYATSQLKKMEKSYGASKGYALHGERDATQDPYSVEAGYDTKNAMHLIRLLHCGCELLKTGEYPVWVTWEAGRGELLAIRHGEWKMFEVINEAQALFNRMDELLKTTELPDEPDREWAEQFLCEAHLQSVEGK